MKHLVTGRLKASDILKKQGDDDMSEYSEFLKKLTREAIRDAESRLGEKEEDNDLPPDWTSIDTSTPMVTDGWSEPVQILLQSGLIKDNFSYNGRRFLPIIGKNISPKSTIVAWRHKEDVPYKIHSALVAMRREFKKIPQIENPYDGSGTNFYYETSEGMRYERYYIDRIGTDVKIMKENKLGGREQVYKDKVFLSVQDARRFLCKEAGRNGWWLVNGRAY